MGKKLNIRPDTGVYGTYKRISYQPWTVLGEFVDNSTQSFYDHKEELFNTKYYKGLEIEIEYIEDPISGDEIKIIDNAYGMDYSDFTRALILDRPPKKTTGRNEFGMGLKAAACWFGNLWSVETTALGNSFKYKAEIDIESLIKYKNEEIDVQEEMVNPKEHYTIITIKKINKKKKGKRIEKKIHELLSSIYRVDIRTGDIKIYYNGNLLEFNEVVPYIDENGKTWKKGISFSVPYKDTMLEVNGFIGIRIPSSPRDAGYTLLRRGRVIVGGPEKNYRPYEIFGASNSFAYQRLYGELEMDNWPVTQAKDAFDWSNEDLEAKFIETLREISEEFKKKSESIRIREKVKVSDVAEQLRKSFQGNENITEVIIEIEDKQEDLNHETDIEENDEGINESAGVGVEIEDNVPISIKLKYREKTYDFVFVFDDVNPRSEWLRLEPINVQENKYKLTLNILHVFFYPFIQKRDFLVVLARFAAALVIAEINAYSISQNGKVSPSSIRLAMGQILEDLTNE